MGNLLETKRRSQNVVTSVGLIGSLSEAGGLVDGLALLISHCSKIHPTIIREELLSTRQVRDICIEITCNENAGGLSLTSLEMA